MFVWFQEIMRRLFDRDDDSPAVVVRKRHAVSRKNISGNALKVLYRLKDAGFDAFLVGGGVRDILLKRQPKDFDVVTNAHPEDIRRIFRNSRIIGRRFRLVHVYYKDELIEVSTFRSNISEDTRTEIHEETGMIHRDNTYGTIEEDAWRRDFTINALYYNIADHSIVDYTKGLRDLKRRLVRVIGDPVQRFHEDPVRMLRAIRQSAKLNFSIESEAKEALLSLSHLLQHVPPSRLFDELIKLFFEGHGVAVYRALADHDYLSVLFPQTTHVLTHHKNNTYQRLIDLAVAATDKRLCAGQSVNPGFLLAVFLWPALQYELNQSRYKKNKFFMRLHHVIGDVLQKQVEVTMISRRYQTTMQSIWLLQFYLEKRRPKRIMHSFNHRYFRAAYDFMCLRAEAGESLSEACEWWRNFQDANQSKQQAMIDALRNQR